MIAWNCFFRLINKIFFFNWVTYILFANNFVRFCSVNKNSSIQSHSWATSGVLFVNDSVFLIKWVCQVIQLKNNCFWTNRLSDFIHLLPPTGETAEWVEKSPTLLHRLIVWNVQTEAGWYKQWNVSVLLDCFISTAWKGNLTNYFIIFRKAALTTSVTCKSSCLRSITGQTQHQEQWQVTTIKLHLIPVNIPLTGSCSSH